MQWQGEALKAILFTTATDLQAHDIFKNITGGDPDSFQRAAMGSIAVGDWDGLQAAVGVQGPRVEISLAAKDDPNSPAPPRNMTDLKVPLERVREAARHLAGFPATRLAAVLQLVHEVADQDAGAVELNKLLDKDLFKPGGTDLVYQFNIPRVSTSASDIRLNRLCKWGVASQTMTLIALSAGGPMQQQSAEKRDVVFLHLDFNNVPVSTPMDSATATKLTDELWNDALRVMENGSGVLV